MDLIAARLDRIRKHRLLSPAMARQLAPVHPLMVKAGLLGSDPAGLFKVPSPGHQTRTRSSGAR